MKQEFPIGSLVIFDWWAEYKAPATHDFDASGHALWFELKNGDQGVVLVHYEDGEHLGVLFSNYTRILRVHHEMLTAVCHNDAV